MKVPANNVLPIKTQTALMALPQTSRTPLNISSIWCTSNIWSQWARKRVRILRAQTLLVQVLWSYHPQSKFIWAPVPLTRTKMCSLSISTRANLNSLHWTHKYQWRNSRTWDILRLLTKLNNMIRSCNRFLKTLSRMVKLEQPRPSTKK